MRTSTRMTLLGIGLLSVIFAFGMASPAFAFHGGGVAHCNGCHSMHNSADNPVTGSPNNLLLKGTDPSSTCLNCHAAAGRSYNIMSSDASSFTPGGDFFWLTANYTNTVRGNAVSNDPDQAGHNVIAVDFGLTADANNTTAPGGSYPANSLACTSCHDPHGQVGGGTAAGQLPISVSGSYGDVPPAGTIAGNYRLLSDELANPAPTAVTNRSFSESDTSHPAYGQNMSEFCANCHGLFVNDNHKHPAGNNQFLDGQATAYNAYVSTGDYTGSSGTSFLQFVQFERQETDIPTLLAGVTSTAGPDNTDNVMCLTCHRAHASAFDNIGRWDFNTEFLAESTPNAQNLIDIGAVPFAPYYGRDIATEFGEYQRSFCNKCHVQD